MMLLTRRISSAILNTLSQKTKVGVSSPRSNGVKTPIQGVFYCLKKIVTVKIRAFVMVARNGQPQGWPVSTSPFGDPLPGTANLLRVAAQQLADVGGGSYIQAMEPSI
ncbi:ash family protein [Methylomonas rapida]|uniref:Ash family protein n=1 Tax=Methylomonas rapida TaxID=2963939 RepID=A0ABY7GEM3_9GAMM|nr:ash family protein [Methylomonas rapida]WAR43730.1 ash family protein [Methylomonas rapida]